MGRVPKGLACTLMGAIILTLCWPTMWQVVRALWHATSDMVGTLVCIMAIELLAWSIVFAYV